MARPPLIGPVTLRRVPVASAAELIHFGGVEPTRIQDGSGPAIGTDMFRAGPMSGFAVNAGFRRNDATGGSQRQRTRGMVAKTFQGGCLRIKCAKAGIAGVRVAGS